MTPDHPHTGTYICLFLILALQDPRSPALPPTCTVSLQEGIPFPEARMGVGRGNMGVGRGNVSYRLAL